MFKRIFVEEESRSQPRTQAILSRFPQLPVKTIHRIEDIWGRVKRPYLHKRRDINLFIGYKRGELVKTTPPAYGNTSGPHYYYVHAYNCLYECSYCYLQGYFHTPDLVVFVNHEEIGEAIIQKIEKTPRHQTPWFHAGEYSDSLALSSITGEIPFYFNLFNQHSRAKLELRTKSANITPVLECPPLANIITTFSLSPETHTRRFDLKTPPLSARINAMKKLQLAGHPLGIHFDPIIYQDKTLLLYRNLFDDLKRKLDLSTIEYVSLGILRFTKEVYRQVRKNYSDESLFANGITGVDGKIRQIPRLQRKKLFSSLVDMLVERRIPRKKIYLCME